MSHPYNETNHAGFQQKEKTESSEAEVAYGHAKGAKNKLDEFFTPELRRKVEEELYPHDNKLWKLVSASGNKLSNGKALLPKLSDKCSDTKETISLEVVSDEDNQATNLPVNNTATKPFLPEAIQPLTHDKCCIPKAYQGIKNPKDKDCFGTCYNERACNDPVYPFTSAEEKRQFPMNNITREYKQKLQRQCKTPERMTPPVEWCQDLFGGVESEKNGTAAAQLVENIPPAGCSQITNGGGSGAFQHGKSLFSIVHREVETSIHLSHVLHLFCSNNIPISQTGILWYTQSWNHSVGAGKYWIESCLCCTFIERLIKNLLFGQFLRFYFGAKDYPALPHYKLDRDFLQFDALEPQVQRRIWEDTEWTWAAFIRNPAERLLSAYLDKVKSKKDKLKWIEGKPTFEKFVDSISKPVDFTNCGDTSPLSSLSWCSDPREFKFA